MLKILDVDKKILLQLLRDSRQTYMNIAKNSKVTRQTVAKKIEEYIKQGIIRKFIPQLDPEELGLTIEPHSDFTLLS